jgi:3-hydroxymyristoyl/3-hydroxydecanoyl-(acyl carrier protein) dehydratase
MPGVLIVEAMAQVGGVLAFLSQTEEKPGSVIYFTGIDKVRFRRPVVPGDQITFEIEFLKMRSRVVKMAAKALVDGNLVAEAELMASFGATS